MAEKQSRLAGLTEEEKKQLELIDPGLMSIFHLFQKKQGFTIFVTEYQYEKICSLLRIVLLKDQSLAASRASEARKQALLKKHEWDGQNTDEMGEPTGTQYCLECFRNESDGHTPDCAIAAELEDTEGG